MSTNVAVVTKEIYTTIGVDLDTFDRLPRELRRALRESNYEYSAEDALNILDQVRQHMPNDVRFFLRNLSEQDFIEETARHILNTDSLIWRNETNEKLADYDAWLAKQNVP